MFLNIFSLSRLVLAMPFLVVIAHAQTSDMHIRFDEGDKWEMTQGGKDTFSTFLADEMADVKSQVPNLFWPTVTEHTDFKEIVLSAFYPASGMYKNRPLQCAFVQKVLNTTNGAVRDRFLQITHNGQVCIQYDLSKSEWATFTENLMTFFWTEKWLLVDGAFFSLEDLVVQAVGPTYKRPEFHIATRIEFDGYGWGFSDSELEIFQVTPVLEKYATLAQEIDPNSDIPFTALGPEVEKILKGSPYGTVGAFQPSSKIYISNAWGPADLVELLAHEYGHVFHGETNRNVEWESATGTLVVHANGVHNESVAESFAWMLLRDVYSAYPEIKFFHLAKLQLFQSLQPKDPHLLGAAVVGRLFHSDEDGTFDDLREYASFLDLNQYITSYGFEGILNNLGNSETTTIPVIFSSH